MGLVETHDVTTGTKSFASHAGHKANARTFALAPGLKLVDNEIAHFGVDCVEGLGNIEFDFRDGGRKLFEENFGRGGACEGSVGLEAQMAYLLQVVVE